VVGVIELVRRRRLLERYSLVWLFSSFVLLGLASWRGALDRIAQEIGVAYPPNALFIVAFGFVLWMLLHFSVAVSRLTDQSKILAQRLALLEERTRRAEAARSATELADDREVELAEVGHGSPQRTFHRSGKR
jgi:hypothetical protein